MAWAMSSIAGRGDDLAQDAHPLRHDGRIGRSRQVGDPGGELGRCHVLHRPGDRKLTDGCGDFLRAVTLAIPRGGLRRRLALGRSSGSLLVRG